MSPRQIFREESRASETKAASPWLPITQEVPKMIRAAWVLALFNSQPSIVLQEGKSKMKFIYKPRDVSLNFPSSTAPYRRYI